MDEIFKITRLKSPESSQSQGEAGGGCARREEPAGRVGAAPREGQVDPEETLSAGRIGGDLWGRGGDQKLRKKSNKGRELWGLSN